MNRKFFLAGALALGLFTSTTTAAEPFVVTSYYSDASMTLEVGVRFKDTDGVMITLGTITPYSRKYVVTPT